MRRTLAFIFLCFVACGLCAEESGGSRKPRLIIDTNLAYLSLGALSTNADNLFLIVPLEAQLPINAWLSLLPSLTFISFGKASRLSGGAMLLGECGISYHPEALGSSGWCFELSPGIAYAFDSRLAGLVVSGEGGYQWLLGKSLFLGLSGGGKYIYLDGTLLMPDLKLRLGFAL